MQTIRRVVHRFAQALLGHPKQPPHIPDRLAWHRLAYGENVPIRAPTTVLSLLGALLPRPSGFAMPAL